MPNGSGNRACSCAREAEKRGGDNYEKLENDKELQDVKRKIDEKSSHKEQKAEKELLHEKQKTED